jgi:hypothetical protein
MPSSSFLESLASPGISASITHSQKGRTTGRQVRPSKKFTTRHYAAQLQEACRTLTQGPRVSIASHSSRAESFDLCRTSVIYHTNFTKFHTNKTHALSQRRNDLSPTVPQTYLNRVQRSKSAMQAEVLEKDSSATAIRRAAS